VRVRRTSEMPTCGRSASAYEPVLTTVMRKLESSCHAQCDRGSGTVVSTRKEVGPGVVGELRSFGWDLPCASVVGSERRGEGEEPIDQVHRRLVRHRRADAAVRRLVKGDAVARSSQVKSGQVRSNQVKSGQVRSSQVKSGQVRSGDRKSSHLVKGDAQQVALAVLVVKVGGVIGGEGDDARRCASPDANDRV
jgi:hypothetical protein